MNIDEALDLLSEDVLGDLKRKLKGQVSLSDNIRRVAKQELKTALNFAEAVEDLSDTRTDDDEQRIRLLGKIEKANKGQLQALKKALKTIDRIK